MRWGCFIVLKPGVFGWFKGAVLKLRDAHHVMIVLLVVPRYPLQILHELLLSLLLLLCLSVVLALLLPPLPQSRLNGVEGRMVKVREQYAREYRERRRLFNMVQVGVAINYTVARQYR